MEWTSSHVKFWAFILFWPNFVAGALTHGFAFNVLCYSHTSRSSENQSNKLVRTQNTYLHSRWRFHSRIADKCEIALFQMPTCPEGSFWYAPFPWMELWYVIMHSWTRRGSPPIVWVRLSFLCIRESGSIGQPRGVSPYTIMREMNDFSLIAMTHSSPSYERVLSILLWI